MVRKQKGLLCNGMDSQDDTRFKSRQWYAPMVIKKTTLFLSSAAVEIYYFKKRFPSSSKQHYLFGLFTLKTVYTIGNNND